MSELVQLTHLKRKAVVCIRQSTPHQVVSNQESLRLHYALRQRARELGWHEADIDLIDADLALGRKAWLFAGSRRRGDRAACMHALIVTARMNGADPQAWLADVPARQRYVRPPCRTVFRGTGKPKTWLRQPDKIHAIKTVDRGTAEPGDTLDWLHDLAIGMEPEDGII